MLLHMVPLLMVMGSQAPPPPQTTPAVALQRPKTPPKIYNEAADARAQIETALKAAAEDDLRVLINWGANDDEDCARFQQDLYGRPSSTPAHEVIRTKLSNEYKLVTIDVGRLDKNQDLARVYQASLAAGALPHLTILDKTGRVITQQSSRDFAAEPGSARAYDPEKIAAFLKKHQVAPVAAGPLFAAALAEAKRDGKYVFLWFSAPW